MHHLQNKFYVTIPSAKYTSYKTNFVMWSFSLPNISLTKQIRNVTILPSKYTPYKQIL